MSAGSRARTADALTAARIPLAVVVAALLAGGRVDGAIAVVAGGWLSDVFDGRLARSSDGSTRFGSVDLFADLALASGVGAGLVLGGRYSALPALSVGVLLLAAAAWYRNQMPAMVYMAGIDLALIVTAFQAGTWGRTVVVVVLLVMFALDHRRLVDTLIPTFLRGATAIARGQRTTQ
jgi:phosphatidylglycerophosphate synthase